MPNNKAQHEIAGFVIIVVIVAVIGVIVLSLMINRGEVSKTTSVEIENLLIAITQKTSNCSGNLGYYTIDELTSACYNNRQCLEGQSACTALEQELTNIIDKSLNPSPEAINKGYTLSTTYFDLEVEDNQGSEILPPITKGETENCEVKMGASQSIDVGFGGGIININLEVCR